jgi:outer membrane murein-binding lipoprotein Lpp
MSKKLIAVASAAALALSALVGIAPANAAPFNVVVTGAQAPVSTSTSTADRFGDGTTSAKAYKVAVPSADVLRFETESPASGNTADNVRGTAIKLVVTTPGDTDAITVTTTGGIEVVTDTVFDASTAPTTASGVTSLTDVAAAGTATIYAYTTSTATGTIVVSAGGSSRTIYLAGLSTWAYKLNLSAPATAALSGKVTMTGTIVDAFGNNLTTALTWGSFDFTQVGATAPANTTAGFSYSSTTKAYSITWTAPATAQGVAIQATLKDANLPTAVTAFGTPVSTVFGSVSVQDLTAQVTALTAQVAALKADYNALAERWNKRVASKKAPKKAVTLK